MAARPAPPEPAVHVLDRQRAGRVDRARLTTLASALFARACRRDRPARRWSTLTVVLLDDAGMGEVNRRVFDRDHATDVISQAYRPVPGAHAGWAGELYLNVACAQREGRARRGGPARELALYLAHGCDHLTGGLDDTPAQARAMRRRELAWLRHPDLARLIEACWRTPHRRAIVGSL